MKNFFKKNNFFKHKIYWTVQFCYKKIFLKKHSSNVPLSKKLNTFCLSKLFRELRRYRAEDSFYNF